MTVHYVERKLAIVMIIRIMSMIYEANFILGQFQNFLILFQIL